jgi:hypothetical protein
LKVKEAEQRHASKEELAELRLVEEAIFSLRMVGKARFFEKARICGAALVAKNYFIEYLEKVVAPSKHLNHLENRLLKALKDWATLLEMVVLAVVEFKLGFLCIVAKGQFDNAWDWGPTWDRVVAALNAWRRDPSRLLDGNMPCVFGETVERGSGQLIEEVRCRYPLGCEVWEILKLLAAGACEQLEICLTRFAADQLASKRGQNRRNVAGDAVVDALPKMNPSNDLMEGVNGMGKQFLRKRPNARAVLASSHVAYKASGMVD